MFGNGFGNITMFGGNSQSQAETPEKKSGPSQEEKANCLPVTVRLIQEAIENRSADGDIRFHGQEVGQVALVANVENLIKLPTSVEFVANDGTGRLKVRHYQTAESQWNGIEEGRYVSLVGQPRTAPMAHLSALVLRPVETADEISYHTIEVAHAALKLRKGDSRVALQLQTPQPKSKMAVAEMELSPEKTDGTPQEQTPQAPAATSPALTGAALEAAALAFVQQQEESADGVAIADICKNFQAVSSDEVRLAVKALQANGDLYETIDEEHVAPL